MLSPSRFSSIAYRTALHRSLLSKEALRWTQRVASLSTNANAAPPSVVLYQYAICPFCNIAKAAMSFTSVDYKAVEVNPLTKAELKFSKDYRKVPIATLDGEQVNGSDEIVKKIMEHPTVASKLESKLQTMSPEVFLNAEDSKKWVDFARDDLASLLYPNICRTWNDSYIAFGYVNETSFSPFQKFYIQNIGSLAMYFAASKIKQKRNITDERQALNEVIIRIEKEGLGEKKYLSGMDEPNLGDIAVYGTLRSIEGLPAHTDLFEGRDASSPLPGWYKRMKAQVGN